MLKPLLRVIPKLSGNIKLACKIDKFEQISDDEYVGYCRTAWTYPLSSDSFQKQLEVNLLQSSWEYDVAKYYKVYSDIFYKDMFTYDEKNYLGFDNTNVIKDRNSDFEFGCKRVSYSRNGKQLAFFAPIYCTSANDLPDKFAITIKIEGKLFSTEKTLYIDLTKNNKYNYLGFYLYKYYSKMDDNVIYMLPNSKQASYKGINVLYGGFSEVVDNSISDIYNTETSICGYDAKISKGFERMFLAMKQVFPLSFYFNINDILTESEIKKYKNADIYISGVYYKDDNVIEFYNFDDNYTYLNLPVKKFNDITGEMIYVYNSNNVLELNLHEASAKEYHNSNKLNKSYVRWKLKYSTDEYPYITNTNKAFSINDGFNSLYYEFPQNYYASTLLCNINNDNINILLPIGSDIQKHYDDYSLLCNKYNVAMNNYITNWFDMIDNNTLDYIIKNTSWSNVHSDGKIFYNGLLYDFNEIYNNENITNKIDKFAVLCYIDSSLFITNETSKKLFYSKYAVSEGNDFKVNLIGNINNIWINGERSFYEFNTNDYEKTSTITTNEYFTYNLTGEGKYVNINDLNINYYNPANQYYDFTETTGYNSSSVVEGYELLNVVYMNRFMNNNFNNLMNNDKLFFSYGNHLEKYPLSYFNTTITNEEANSYCLYVKRNFIPHYLASGGNNIYIYDPIKNVFTYLDKHNEFRGNDINKSFINNDNDVLYIDPYNIDKVLNNTVNFKGYCYINNINKNERIVTLENIENNAKTKLYYNDDSALDILSYTYTQCSNNDKYGGVEKYITSISNVNVKNGKYYIEVNDKIVGKSTSTVVDNPYLTESYFGGTMYISYINEFNYEIQLQSYSYSEKQPYIIKYNDVNYFRNAGVELGFYNKVNDKYVINKHCTYMYGESYFYKDNKPNYVINKIYNVGYIENPYNFLIRHDNLKANIEKFTDKVEIIDKYYQNSNNKLTELTLSKYIQTNNAILFGKFKNKEQINLFVTDIYEGALNSYNVEYKDGQSFASYIYYKNRQLINEKLVDFYNPISYLIKSDNLNYSELLSYITNNENYSFTINNTYNVELYFKKNFIKVNKEIFDNVIRLNSDSFIDIYLYNFEDGGQDSVNTKTISQSNYENGYNLSYCVYPVFSSNFKQDKEQTILYESYINNLITPVNFINDNGTTYTTLYRYNKENNFMMIDVSNVNMIDNKGYLLFDENGNNVKFTTYTYSFIYNKKSLITNTYISANIKTFDKIEGSLVNNGYVCANDDIAFDKYGLNTYTFNDGTTYGFYLLTLNMLNTSDMFNLSFKNGGNVKYFTYINNKDIVNNHENLTNEFKHILPSCKLNMLSFIYDKNVIKKPFKTSIKDNYKFSNLTYSIIYKNSSNKVTTLFRYYDSIEPVINKENTLNTEYALKVGTVLKQNKTKTVYNKLVTNNIVKLEKINSNINELTYFNDESKISNSTSIKYSPVYNDMYYNIEDCNIYNYKGVRQYINSTKYNTFKQIEYKYFNDNKFLNLEEQFEIFVSDSLTAEDVILNEKEDVVIKYFMNYINKTLKQQYAYDEILFLFNKYNVNFLSNSIKIDKETQQKLYSLTYKFILK